MMKACLSCQQQNPDDSQYCHRCGNSFKEDSGSVQAESSSSQKSMDLVIGSDKSLQFSLGEGWSWRPACVYYQAVFRRFQTNTGHQFALTWHWPAFLFDPFLWFLYRKMYMYALVYAIGPVISAFLTGDFTVGVVWRVIAGATGNYIYYWHLTDQLRAVNARVGLDVSARNRMLGEEGGVQSYVLWLGMALHIAMFVVILTAMDQPPQDEDFFPESDISDEPKFY